MNEEQILSFLCIYDPRNPNHEPDVHVDDNYDENNRQHCACDNCFQHRHLLVLEIIAAHQRIDKFISRF